MRRLVFDGFMSGTLSRTDTGRGPPGRSRCANRRSRFCPALAHQALAATPTAIGLADVTANLRCVGPFIVALLR